MALENACQPFPLLYMWRIIWILLTQSASPHRSTYAACIPSQCSRSRLWISVRLLIYRWQTFEDLPESTSRPSASVLSIWIDLPFMAYTLREEADQ